jgi:hypothetical protein
VRRNQPRLAASEGVTMYVYVISAGPQAQKIGISAKAAVRLSQMQVAHHTTLVLFHMTMVGDARAVERYAHQMLAERSLRGEWFDVSPDEARKVVEVARAAVDRGETSPSGSREPPLAEADDIVSRAYFPPDDPNGSSSVEAVFHLRDVNAEMYRRFVAPRAEAPEVTSP